MRIGQLVKTHIRQVFSYCDSVEHDEILSLLNPVYSKQVFGLSFPFCTVIDEIQSSESRRYWTEIYLVRGKSVRVTSQWYESSRPLFAQYLNSKNIELKPDLKDVSLANNLPKETKVARQSNSRYRGNAIGNAQNLFVRNILSRLGSESFSEKDWEKTKDYFLRKCVYCDAGAELLIEHAIPINKEKLGEHRLGNIIPSCKLCNSKKGGTDFREFLGEKIDRIRKIEEYMDSRNYVPLEDNEQMRMILDMAHKEVAALAERYIKIINELFPQGSEGDSDEV